MLNYGASASLCCPALYLRLEKQMTCCVVPAVSKGLGVKRPRRGHLEEEEEVLAQGPSRCRSFQRVVPSARRGEATSRMPWVLTRPNLPAFLRLLEDDVIQDFLWVDSCVKLSDKYLLAMVYIYFTRASLSVKEYTRMNFFTALYLANDMEEDEEEEKYELFPWALGESWMTSFPSFLRARDQLWRRMEFRAVVSRKTCEEVISLAPSHKAWQRSRSSHHSGAIRTYMKPDSPQYGRSSPPFCVHCSAVGFRVQSEGWGYEAMEGGEDEEVQPKKDLLDEIDSSFGAQLSQNALLRSDKPFSLFAEPHEE